MNNEFSDQEQVCDWLERLRTNINEILENVRRLSRNLSPVIIDDLGLDAALENIVQSFSSVYNITCAYHPQSLDVIRSTDSRRLVYRLVQETLNNIGKHSEATHIDFAINVDEDAVSMKLTDNGRGFDLQEVENRHPEHKGIGLTAMVERTNMLGGTVAIDSTVGTGTTISFTLPLHAALVQDSAEPASADG